MTSTIDAHLIGIELEDWTSAGPIIDPPRLRRTAPDILVRWSTAGTSGSNARSLDVGRMFADDCSTAAGRASPERFPQFQESVTTIRRLSGLTWEQLARVFGVGRRSVHFWARGARPSAENAERISRVLRIVRELDSGDPESTRADMFDAGAHSRSVFELLCEGRDTEAELVSRGLPVSSGTDESHLGERRTRRPPALSATERRRRQVFQLDDLIGGFDADEDTRSPIGGPLGGGLVPGLRI